MQNPTIAARHPVAVDLEKDQEYYWCTCGLSENQPFCDGSHSSTDFKPQTFSPDEDGEAWLCQCKHSQMPPTATALINACQLTKNRPHQANQPALRQPRKNPLSK